MKILIVDDHAIVREGVRRLLSLLPEAKVSEAENGTHALELFAQESPHVVILDINLDGGSGLEVLRRMRSADSGARVVMFSMHADPAYAHRALAAGALAYISKSAPAEELIEAVRKAAGGRRHVDHQMASQMALSPAGADPLDSLTNREAEILRLLGEGKSITDIASTFGIAYKTVANTCTRLKEKLGVERTADLIRISVERARTNLG